MFRTTATASCVAAIFVLAAADSSASAQALRLGSPAPKLDIAAWVQGEPVNPAAEDFDNVLVLEFWATWCGPCRNTFPLLSTMQEEHRGDGLRIVGITREPVELVRQFVSQAGPQMGFAVAVDNDSRTHDAYMRPLGAQGIPYAVVIDRNGTLVWSGYPGRTMFRDVVPKVLAGRYDVAAEQRADEAARLIDAYAALARHEGNAERLQELGAQIIDYAQARPGMLSAFAIQILADPDFAWRDLATARKAAQRGYELSDGAEPLVIEAYARVLFEMGEVDEAISHMRQAIELADEPLQRLSLRTELRRFERAKAASDQ